MYGIRIVDVERLTSKGPSAQRKEETMLKLMKAPQSPGPTEAPEIDRKELEALVCAMGKRMQAEYVEGAIPYLRSHEPETWRQLEALDREESLSALMEYERLFFEGLHRYINYLDTRQKAA